MRSRVLSKYKSGLVDGSPVSPTYQVVVRKCSCVVSYNETTGAALSLTYPIARKSEMRRIGALICDG